MERSINSWSCSETTVCNSRNVALSCSSFSAAFTINAASSGLPMSVLRLVSSSIIFIHQRLSAFQQVQKFFHRTNLENGMVQIIGVGFHRLLREGQFAAL